MYGSSWQRLLWPLPVARATAAAATANMIRGESETASTSLKELGAGRGSLGCC